MSSSGAAQFKLTFEISPIVLTGGIAQNMPGGGLPIISILGGSATDTSQLSLDAAFAHFIPLPGMTLIDQDIGQYPFANQNVAANAVIAKPLSVSYRMIVPVKPPFTYNDKLSIMQTLASTLAKHNNNGGLYTCATPSGYVENCVMLRMVDIGAGGGDTAQAQTMWQLDFWKPLITQADADQAQSALLNKLSNGTQIQGQPAWSGLNNTVGNPNSGAQPSAVPAGQSVGGSGITGASPPPALRGPLGG